MKKIILLPLVLAGFLGHAQHNSGKTKDTTVQFTVYGNCVMCKARIEDAAKGKGVIAASWNSESKVFTLQYNPQQTTTDKVEQRIADVGHDTEKKKAKDFIYKALPDCCLYREGDKDKLTYDDEANDNLLMGVVMEVDEKGNFKPLEGANILLNGSNVGVATNTTGFFKLALENENSFITISYVGFQPEKIEVKPGQHLNIECCQTIAGSKK